MCKCQKLEKFFSKRKNTGLFLKTCDPCRAKRVKCPQCDASFSENKSVKRHIKMVHDKIRDHVCPKEECEAKFSMRSSLKLHVKTVHDKIRDYECDRCDMKFLTKKTLQDHVQGVHDKMRNFECDRCDMKFFTNKCLKRHIKGVHDKIRDFECDRCGYKTSHNTHLSRHIETCTGELNISSYELAARKVFELFNIKYEAEKKFETCRNINVLPFDFYLPDHNKLVEIDGEGHYRAVFGSTREERLKNLENTQKRDKIKDKWAEDHGIPLLRIPYFRINEVMDLIKEFVFDR